MSEVKSLIHELCSMNLFEMGGKKQRKNENIFSYHLNEKACERSRYVLLY